MEELAVVIAEGARDLPTVVEERSPMLVRMDSRQHQCRSLGRLTCGGTRSKKKASKNTSQQSRERQEQQHLQHAVLQARNNKSSTRKHSPDPKDICPPFPPVECPAVTDRNDSREKV